MSSHRSRIDRDKSEEVWVEVEIDDNGVDVKSRRVLELFKEIEGLFDSDGRYVRDHGDRGWSGIEKRDDGYYRVQTDYDSEEPFYEERLTRQDVKEIIERDIREEQPVGNWGDLH